MDAGKPESTRSRFREQIRAEIQSAALAQLLNGGLESVSLKSIARDLNLTGPALYRYVASRDDLMGSLFIDAYEDLADAVEAEGQAFADPVQRVHAMVVRYRAWAIDQPHRYRLIFLGPFPGAEHHERLWSVRQRFNGIFIRALNEVPSLRSQDLPVEHPRYNEWASTYLAEPVDPAVLRASLSILVRLHGFVTLEIAGNFDPEWIDGDRIFEHEFRDITGTEKP